MKTRRRKKMVPVPEEPFAVVDIEDFETVCHVCDAEFLDEEDLRLHITQMHLNESNGKMICKICCTVLPGAEVFVSHFIYKHLENSLFCFYCYRAFANKLLLDQHELKHHLVTNESSMTCSQCSKNFTNRHTLQKHEYQEHGNTEDSLLLNGFFSLLSSALNIKIKTFLDCVCKKKPLVCHNCKYSSSSVKKFINHLRNSNCQSFACDTCFTVYKKKSSVITHMRMKPQCHNFVIEKEILELCPKCEKYFNCKDIGDHRVSCTVVKCLICNKLFKSISELTEHRTEEHKAYISLESCKFCKKQFVGMLNLKKHLRRAHKNRRLYKYNCAYCSSLFIHPRKLFAHFYTQHKDIQPYTCKICNKCFRLRKHFTIHIKLIHKSVGFVEFSENMHVTFTDKKSDTPIETQDDVSMMSDTDTSDTEFNDDSQEKRPMKGNMDITEAEISISPDNKVSKDTNMLNIHHEVPGLYDVYKIEHRGPSPKRQKQIQKLVRPQPKQVEFINEFIDSPDRVSDDSEDEPLSNIKQSLNKDKDPISINLRKRMVIRDKKAKLTCKVCNKYCYTVQNYHHHMSLHEKRKMKKCIKCHQCYRTMYELKKHMENAHSSSKLTETLKSVLEKRKSLQPAQKPGVRAGESLKSLIEKRKKLQAAKTQNSITYKFRKTIQKVNVTDNCTATITPLSEHGLSVKNFIENFRPEGDNVNISNSVTIRAITIPIDKDPTIKMYKFTPEPPPVNCHNLSFPVKFHDPPVACTASKVSVKLLQKLITKPKVVNMSYDERIPVLQDKKESDKYCNMFADDTDYSEYKNDVIPEVAQEVMLGDLEDIPRTRRLAQEIIIPKIPEEHGGVRIGHLLPQAPFYKIVQVKKLIKAANKAEAESDPEPADQDVQLPDGTRLISVKNPYSHLIPNEHLEEVLKANRNKNYTPKTKNIGKAIAKALKQVRQPRRNRKKLKEKVTVSSSDTQSGLYEPSEIHNDIQGAHDDLQEAHDDIQEAHDNLQEAHDHLQEAHDIPEAYDDLQEAHDALQEVHDNLQRPHDDIQEFHHDLHEAHDDIPEPYGVLQEAHDDIQEAHDDLDEVHLDIQEAYDDLQEVHLDIQEAHDDLQETHDDIHGAHDDLQEAHDDIQGAHDDIQLAHDDLHETHDDIQEVQDDIPEPYDDLQETHDDLDEAHDYIQEDDIPEAYDDLQEVHLDIQEVHIDIQEPHDDLQETHDVLQDIHDDSKGSHDLQDAHDDIQVVHDDLLGVHDDLLRDPCV